MHLAQIHPQPLKDHWQTIQRKKIQESRQKWAD
jgi:hypothetical protein